MFPTGLHVNSDSAHPSIPAPRKQQKQATPKDGKQAHAHTHTTSTVPVRTSPIGLQIIDGPYSATFRIKKVANGGGFFASLPTKQCSVHEMVGAKWEVHVSTPPQCPIVPPQIAGIFVRTAWVIEPQGSFCMCDKRQKGFWWVR